MKVNEMSDEERNVYNAILRGSIDNPVSRLSITDNLGLSKRRIERVVESLIYVHDIPVVSRLRKPSGYYIARNVAELNEGMKHYKQQIITSQQRVKKLMSIELEGGLV